MFLLDCTNEAAFFGLYRDKFSNWEHSINNVENGDAQRERERKVLSFFLFAAIVARLTVKLG